MAAEIPLLLMQCGHIAISVSRRAPYPLATCTDSLAAPPAGCGALGVRQRALPHATPRPLTAAAAAATNPCSSSEMRDHRTSEPSTCGEFYRDDPLPTDLTLPRPSGLGAETHTQPTPVVERVAVFVTICILK